MFKRTLSRPLFRYAVVGGLSYIVDIAVLIGLHSGLHTSRELAVGISFWAGLIFSFVLQKFVAFQDYQKELKAVSRQTFWYAVLVAFNYALTIAIVGFFPSSEIILSRTIAVAVTTCWNFIFYKRIIFSKKHAQHDLLTDGSTATRR